MRCEIIKDLLPLYCDDALSDVSKEEVEKHIAECDDCKKTYEYMKNGDIKLDTASRNIEPLKKVKKKMRLTKIFFAFILLAVVLLGTAYELFCLHPRLAKSDQISFIPEVTYYGVQYRYPNPDEDENHPFIVPIQDKEEKDIKIDKDKDCVYVDGEKLLDENGKPVPANGEVVPWGKLRIGVHIETSFNAVREKVTFAPIPSLNVEAEFRPCLPFRQDMNKCIQNESNTMYFDFPLEYLTMDTTLTIHCRDDDIVIRPYTFSGLMIEEQS